MFGTMVAMAERLIEKILEGATVDKTAFASGTSSTEKKDLKRQVSSSYASWTLQVYTQLARTQRADPDLVGRILGTVSYVFTNHTAIIVSLALHRTNSQDEHRFNAIITLHRTCALMFFIL